MRTLTLPQLDGRLGLATRIVYMLVALATAAVVVGSLIFNALDMFRNQPAGARWGIQTFSSVEAGAPPYVGHLTQASSDAGVRLQDTFVAIGGEVLPAHTSEFGIGRRLDSATGDRLTVVTRDQGGGVAEHVLIRVPDEWSTREASSGLPLWVFSAGSFVSLEIIPLFLVAASLLLFGRRPRDPEAMLFALGFLFLCNVPAVDFWLLAILDVPVSVFAALLATGQCLVIIAAAGFPGGRYDSVWSRVALIAAIPVTAATTIIRHLAANPTQGRIVAAAGLLSLSAAAMLGLRRRYLHSLTRPAQQQVKWVVLGFWVSAVCNIVYMWLLSADLRDLNGNIALFVLIQLIQAAAFLALPLGLVVSLLRYRLYDAEATISRSAAYLLLTLSLVAVFAASEKVLEIVGGQVFGGEIGVVAGAASAGVAAVLITPMHHRIDQWAKRHFQRALVELREEIPPLVGDMREVASLDLLADAVVGRVARGLHASRVALVEGERMFGARGVEADETAGWTRDHGAGIEMVDEADPLFPLRLPLRIADAAPIGLLLLGPRPDGSFYGRDELAALAAITDPIARALVICRQREAAEAAVAERIAALVARVETLERERSSTKAGAADQPTPPKILPGSC